MNLVEEVKKKKEFSGLPNSVVKRALVESGDDVKDARSLLRKYFGVFLTNRVLKGKGDLLGVHMSSKKRDYEEFYSRIFDGGSSVGSVIDLGCGVNGFSYEYLPEGVEYVGIEAAGQLVELMNVYFDKEGFDARVVCLDLFDVGKVLDILRKAKKPRVVFMFQVIDALENMKRDFSKEFISAVMENAEVLVISLPMVSLGGRKRFEVNRKWLVDFLESEFVVKKDFEMFGERILIVKRKGI
jgi:Ribosomal RNA methyltransferase (FmrO)